LLGGEQYRYFSNTNYCYGLSNSASNTTAAIAIMSGQNPTQLTSTASSDAATLTASTGNDSSSALERWLQPNAKAAAVFELVKRSGDNLTNKAWSFFHLVKRERDANADVPILKDNQVYACCNMCGDLVVVGGIGVYKKNVTHWRNSAMASHLASNKHSTTADALFEQIQTGNKKRKAQTTLRDFSTSGRKKMSFKLRQQIQDVKTVKYIVKNNLPFRIVEDDAFREMILSHNANAKVMSNKKVKNIIITLEQKMRDAAVASMKGQSVCLTLDHWTSKAHHNYTGVTAHFIDPGWKAHNMSLGIFLHEGPSTAIDLERSFLKLCLEKLSSVKIFACTTDTTANMNSFGMKLEKMGVAHIYCSDHVLHLTCKLCYTKSEKTFGIPYATSMQKAKAVVTFFHKSTQATEKLKKKQDALESCKGEPKGVVDDVVTRWWSTFDMISRLLELRPAIDIMATEGQLGDMDPLSVNDWNHLRDISLVLKPFKEAQKHLEFGEV